MDHHTATACSAANEQKWQCSACGALLGLIGETRVYIRYKTLEAMAEGRVTVRCRRCTALNTMERPRSSAGVAS